MVHSQLLGGKKHEGPPLKRTISLKADCEENVRIKLCKILQISQQFAKNVICMYVCIAMTLCYNHHN